MGSKSGLPKGLVLAKPISQEKYDESEIYDLERGGLLVITRKRDGWKLLAYFDTKGKARLYTDGINEIDARLDHIKRELEKLRLPAHTILVGEAVPNLENADSRSHITSTLSTKDLDKALRIQKEYGWVRFMCFGIAKLKVSQGNKYSGLPSILTVQGIINDYNGTHNVAERLRFVTVAPILKISFDEAKKLAIESSWEGLVLYDKSYALTFRMDGKEPERIRGCYKWKPIQEDDFIVRQKILRPDNKTVKEVVLSQIDPSTRQEFNCGKFGGFSAQMREDLANMELPIVMQIRFEGRFPKSGKLVSPRFMEIRDDKPVEHCLSAKTYPEAELATY